ncbi:ATPase [Psychromonas marina]|uniref:histidine kinase n=1 Tax=Psychromonas marina TaxID=88364 RepID=A0ABQ6DXT8_9GAMM|nr:ATP-binding protein [Psychromonas marina]GLS89912.1 ATPase [Psychromonas marina]
MPLKTFSQGRRITLIWLFLYCLTLVASVHWLWQFSYQQLQTQNQQQLDRFSRHLESQLGHYAYIPQLLSHQEIVIKALQLADNSAQLELTNRHLASVNNIIGSSDTYLLDATGTTIAASNWLTATTFIGNNFAFRPYFQDAKQGLRGRYFALGSTSGKRGYYFSYPVIYAAEVIGVIVVKMDMSSIEKDWLGKEQLFLVTDSNDVVFISSEKKWLFNSLSPLSDNIKEELLKSRRYLDSAINSLSTKGDFSENSTLLSVQNKHYLSLINDTSREGWNIRVLAPITPILFNISMLIMFISLLYMLLYLITTLIKQKQTRQEEQVLAEVKAKQQLEFTVMQRTSALQAEIEERHKAERALRSTQKELIQSAKLALLGQLSTSISHELNNPLAAIRSYAENAVTFLQRDNLEMVESNLSRIIFLTERMAKISAQLKSFARKSDGQLHIISLQPVILAAHELLKPQFKASQTTLTMQLPEQPIEVKAEPIQLEQIIVNLLSNAMQAMQKSEHKQVEITLTIEANIAIIKVLDRGTGINKTDLPHLFEPFFTTKETGLGLGLSISQQIITNMQGKLSARNRHSQGAVFSISLPIAKQKNTNKETL